VPSRLSPHGCVYSATRRGQNPLAQWKELKGWTTRLVSSWLEVWFAVLCFAESQVSLLQSLQRSVIWATVMENCNVLA